MLEIGKGNERLERWFFDGNVQLCRNFIYRGAKGNSNNFLSRESCQKNCKGLIVLFLAFLLQYVLNDKQHHLVSEMNPCGEGEPLVDSNGERILCTGGQRLDSCPKTHYCHVGTSSLTTLCCKRRGEILMRQYQTLIFFYNFKHQSCQPSVIIFY